MSKNFIEIGGKLKTTLSFFHLTLRKDMTNQDGTDMPLNQKQRDQITPYIEHFFYDLSSSDPVTLGGLKTALEKSLVPVVAE
jgi:hypothetical protein